jgi:hypothetical protein
LRTTATNPALTELYVSPMRDAFIKQEVELGKSVSAANKEK